jgi:hypothetical protein
MKYFIGFNIIMLSTILLLGCEKEKLSYIYEESSHNEFKIEDGLVIFRDDITVENKTDKELSFTMKADITREQEIGLTKEAFAFAYEKSSDKQTIFVIEPNSKTTYTAYFKAKKDYYNKKTNRLPPENVQFKIQ